MSQIIEYHHSSLPHYQEAGQVISLTWRLSFTLPVNLQKLLAEMKAIIQSYSELKDDNFVRNQKIKEYKEKVLQWDNYLGKLRLPELKLSEPKTANIIMSAFKFYDNNLYNLHSYCIMPNHIHLLLEPKEDDNNSYYKISDIIKRIKAFTAKEINKLNNQKGTIWCKDYFDRYIRNEKDYGNTIMYIMNNPVKAGLVENYIDWEYSYYNNGLIRM